MSLRSTLGLSREASLLEGGPDEVAAKRRRANVDKCGRRDSKPHAVTELREMHLEAGDASRQSGGVSLRLRVRSARAEGCGRSARATCPSLPARGSP